MPVFKLLARKCSLKVFYTWGEDGAKAKYDPAFKQTITWDIPLLKGYQYEFIANHAKHPGSHHYRGINNSDLNIKIESFSPDAILVYGWAYKSHLAALRYFNGKIPIWFRGDSNLLDRETGIKSFIKGFFLKWIYQHTQKAFYVGTANKAYFEEFGLKSKQLIFAPHAIDNQRFSEDRNEEASWLRVKLSVNLSDQLILFAGKLENKKNPMLLLQAFSELNLDGVHLLFVGNGELEEQLKASVSTTLSMTNVHFLGFQNQTQMPVVYQACDLFVLPSQGPGETWGLAVNEAMASGKAVLVSDKVGSAKDLVRPDRNGNIFKSNDLKDLKSKLSTLLSDHIKLKQMGLKSKQIIKNWSFEVQVKVFIDTLNESN